ncbi:hypothetical protein NECID01_1038 [Nematocida sp. AWRm77]|nr:hypothetical protein NECID01_1038 [Nematocida sp. AWRm77]
MCATVHSRCFSSRRGFPANTCLFEQISPPSLVEVFGRDGCAIERAKSAYQNLVFPWRMVNLKDAPDVLQSVNTLCAQTQESVYISKTYALKELIRHVHTEQVQDENRRAENSLASDLPVLEDVQGMVTVSTVDFFVESLKKNHLHTLTEIVEKFFNGAYAQLSTRTMRKLEHRAKHVYGPEWSISRLESTLETRRLLYLCIYPSIMLETIKQEVIEMCSGFTEKKASYQERKKEEIRQMYIIAGAWSLLHASCTEKQVHETYKVYKQLCRYKGAPKKIVYHTPEALELLSRTKPLNTRFKQQVYYQTIPAEQTNRQHKEQERRRKKKEEQERRRKREEALKKCEEAVRQQEEDLKKQKEELIEWKEELNKYEEEVRQYGEKCKQLKEQIQKCTDEIMQNYSKEFLDTKEDLIKREEALKQQEEEFKKKEEEFRKLKERHITNAYELKKCEDKLTQQSEEFKRAKEDLKNREEELEQQEEDLRKREEELKNDKDNITKGEKELKQQEKKLAKQEKELIKREQELSQLEEALKKQDEELTQLKEALTQREEEVRRFEKAKRKEEEEASRKAEEKRLFESDCHDLMKEVQVQKNNKEKNSEYWKDRIRDNITKFYAEDVEFGFKDYFFTDGKHTYSNLTYHTYSSRSGIEKYMDRLSPDSVSSMLEQIQSISKRPCMKQTLTPKSIIDKYDKKHPNYSANNTIKPNLTIQVSFLGQYFLEYCRKDLIFIAPCTVSPLVFVRRELRGEGQGQGGDEYVVHPSLELTDSTRKNEVYSISEEEIGMYTKLVELIMYTKLVATVYITKKKTPLWIKPELTLRKIIANLLSMLVLQETVGESILDASENGNLERVLVTILQILNDMWTCEILEKGFLDSSFKDIIESEGLFRKFINIFETVLIRLYILTDHFPKRESDPSETPERFHHLITDKHTRTLYRAAKSLVDSGKQVPGVDKHKLKPANALQIPERTLSGTDEYTSMRGVLSLKEDADVDAIYNFILLVFAAEDFPQHIRNVFSFMFSIALETDTFEATMFIKEIFLLLGDTSPISQSDPKK